MARALVTGASGFIGPQLVESLVARGDDVACLVRSTSNVDRLQPFGPRLLTGDVCQPDSLPAAVAEAEVVYHLAGLTKANGYARYCCVNEAGVRNMVEACASRTSPPLVILVSSLSAAGPMLDDRLRTERDPPQPVSNYGKSKRAGELAAEAKAGDVPITVIRPPMVLGPGDEQGVALFRSVKRMGIHLALGLGKRVSVVYVADLVSAMIAAAEKGERLPAEPAEEIGRGYYFVAGDKHPMYSELGPMVGQALGKPNVKVLRMPMVAMWMSAVCGTIASRLTGNARYMCLDRAKEIIAGNWVCSAEKAARDLGYAPSAPLEEQLRWTAQWYLREGWL